MDRPYLRRLGRNVYEDEAASHASDLAAYVRSAVACIEEQPPARIAGGIIRFPDVGALS